MTTDVGLYSVAKEAKQKKHCCEAMPCVFGAAMFFCAVGYILIRWIIDLLKPVSSAISLTA